MKTYSYLRQKWVKLPSIEAQTIAFFEYARTIKKPRQSASMDWRKSMVYVRLYKDIEEPRIGLIKEALVIANVVLPKSLQGRGWFLRYCQLCASLAEDGVIIESVGNDKLAEAIRKRPEFIEYLPRYFILKKSHPRDWPFTYLKPPRY